MEVEDESLDAAHDFSDGGEIQNTNLTLSVHCWSSLVSLVEPG